MGKILNTYNRPKLKHEDTEKLNRPTSYETESITKSPPTKKTPGSDGFTAEFYKTPEEELTPILQSLIQKTKKEGAPQIHYARLVDTKTTQRHSKKKERKLHTNTPNKDAKILNK